MGDIGDDDIWVVIRGTLRYQRFEGVFWHVLREFCQLLEWDDMTAFYGSMLLVTRSFLYFSSFSRASVAKASENDPLLLLATNHLASYKIPKS